MGTNTEIHFLPLDESHTHTLYLYILVTSTKSNLKVICIRNTLIF